MCMWFGYNPHSFLTLFSQFELGPFSGILTMKVIGQGMPCVRNTYSFIMPPTSKKLRGHIGLGLSVSL